jgi:nicotinamide mononucleotide transporter
VITGLLCVYLAAANSIWNWPVAIISTGIYVFIFAHTQLYADMGLNAYLLAASVYGWIYWSAHAAASKKLPVARMTRRQLLTLLLTVFVVTPALGFTLVNLAPVLHFKPASFPYLDSFLMACSLVAQLLMARKVLENWLIWIFADFIYVGVYLVKGLQPTAFLYAVYIPIALYGYLDWRREYRRQKAI